MNVNVVKLFYFSPTKTTMKVLEGIAEGMGGRTIEHFELTRPASAPEPSQALENDIAIIGTPVYSGRVPIDAAERLKRINAHGTPAIVVVVYGNREYEDALLELKDLASEAGFKPIAGGAFIGEHSFSIKDMPIAEGRPDGDDMKKAHEFGAAVKLQLTEIRLTDAVSALSVPGNFPYKDRPQAAPITPITQDALCTTCGTCAEVCPTAAITVNDGVDTDATACIRCCACVKSCPTTARVMTNEKMNEIRKRLHTNCAIRKEPEWYMA